MFPPSGTQIWSQVPGAFSGLNKCELKTWAQAFGTFFPAFLLHMNSSWIGKREGGGFICYFAMPSLLCFVKYSPKIKFWIQVKDKNKKQKQTKTQSNKKQHKGTALCLWKIKFKNKFVLVQIFLKSRHMWKVRKPRCSKLINRINS